jgi:hypothetical protein
VIGLIFFAAIGVWIIVGYQLAPRVPRWLGIKTARGGSVATGVFLLVYTIGPFADHIVGMWQFQRLCERETDLQVFPSAVNARSAKQLSARLENVPGYFAIVIERQDRKIVSRETGDVIAEYKYFTTSGGWLARSVSLLGHTTCSISRSDHPKNAQYLEFKRQFDLTYGGKE